MGCCCASPKTTAGTRLLLPEVIWDGGEMDHVSKGVEVGGIPLKQFLMQFSGLGPEEQNEVANAVTADLGPIAGMPSGGVAAPVSGIGIPRSGILQRRPVRVGTFSWNVGGISDNRKEAGCGIHESSRGDVMKVLAAFEERMGAVDVIVVGLQETISLTPQNAMKVMSSAGDFRLKTQFYSWPATVAQWVEILLGGLNTYARSGGRVVGSSSSSRDERLGEDQTRMWRREKSEEDDCSYALYGQPVYLFGMLLCVFCRTEVLKHIKDFGMVEKALDDTFKSGAKGVVACRFVLFDRSFCFINCHLTAQKKNGNKYNLKSFEKRLMQLQRIWQEVKFKSQVDQMVYPVSAHRAVFLLGDTNFRISPPATGRLSISRITRATLRKKGPSTSSGASSSSRDPAKDDAEPADAFDMVRQIDSLAPETIEEVFADLWTNDQLYKELRRHQLLTGGASGSSGGTSGGSGSGFGLFPDTGRPTNGTTGSSYDGDATENLRETGRVSGSTQKSARVVLTSTSGMSLGTSATTATGLSCSSRATGVSNARNGLSSRAADKALMLWREPVTAEQDGPPFQPTFKLNVPGPGYNTKRIPAWTDRVLYRSQHVQPQMYNSVKQAEVLKPPRNISDHDPVYARFEVECVTVQSRKLAALIREVRRRGRGDSSPTVGGGRREAEQALNFRLSISDSAQPEIEDFARRLFTSLQDILGPDEALGGAAQLLEYQEECWHLVCNNYETMIRDTVRRAVNEQLQNGEEIDGTVMNRAIQALLEELRGNTRHNSVYVV